MASGGIVRFVEPPVPLRSKMDEELVKDAFHNNNDVEWLKFPFQINDLDDKTNEELLNHFTGECPECGSISHYRAFID